MIFYIIYFPHNIALETYEKKIIIIFHFYKYIDECLTFYSTSRPSDHWEIGHILRDIFGVNQFHI